MDREQGSVRGNDCDRPETGLLAHAPAWVRAGATALPLIALALTFAFYAVHPRLSAERLSFLGSILQTQFLVIHSSAFLLLLLTIRSRTWKGMTLRVAGLAFFGAFYVYFLLQYGTWWAVEFAVLTVMTWFGPLTRLGNPNTAPELLVRWIVNFVVLLVATGVSGMPSGVDEWTTCGRTPWAGLLYYGALAGVEFTPVYPVGTRVFRAIFSLLGEFMRHEPGRHGGRPSN